MPRPFCCPAAAVEECCVGHREATDGSELCLCLCEGYGKVCPCAKNVAKRHAIRATAALYQDSFVFRPRKHISNEQQRKQMPLCAVRVFQQDELVIGDKLGAGGFCQVHHVRIRDGDHHENMHQYAIKFLKRQTIVDKKRFLQGAADIAVEVNFLAAFSNEIYGCGNSHIIKLHGVAEGLIDTEDGGFEDRQLFVIMDQLVETLDHRMYHKWKAEHEINHDMFHPLAALSHEFRRKRQDALVVRLNVALEVADAMRYLHSLKVVYRDLKPENFGFDQDGVGKLYDFGLATELKHPLLSGKYNLSGGAGSIRYMAPEVELGEPYDLSVDVYSYGVLLYELAGLQKPYDGYDAKMHMQHVVKNGERPHQPQWFPKDLHALIEACWSPKPDLRPTFCEIVERLGDLANHLAPSEASSSKSSIVRPHEILT